MNQNMLTIVYDNRKIDPHLKSGWGFSCHIAYAGKRILFDTGSDAKKLVFNLKQLNIEPTSLDGVVLSHSHWDHTGGLGAILDQGVKGPIFFPEAFPDSFKWRLGQKGILSCGIRDIKELSPGIFVGPEMRGSGPNEIPLVLETDQGMVIITGCAHPDILKMIKEIKMIFGKSIYLVLGGFHWEFLWMIGGKAKQLKRLEVENVAPCHCTGDRAIQKIKNEYGDHFLQIGVGLKIFLKDLKTAVDL